MKILLGRRKDDGENCWLTKHKWDCEWYWSFGYLENWFCHYHFDSFLNTRPQLASELFSETNISDADWWVIRDLFIQAYALKRAAEVYRHGGHQTSRKGTTDMLRDAEKAARLNEDLTRLLETLWDFCQQAAAPKGETV